MRETARGGLGEIPHKPAVQAEARWLTYPEFGEVFVVRVYQVDELIGNNCAGHDKYD